MSLKNLGTELLLPAANGGDVIKSRGSVTGAVQRKVINQACTAPERLKKGPCIFPRNQI